MRTMFYFSVNYNSSIKFFIQYYWFILHFNFEVIKRLHSRLLKKIYLPTNSTSREKNSKMYRLKYNYKFLNRGCQCIQNQRSCSPVSLSNAFKSGFATFAVNSRDARSRLYYMTEPFTRVCFTKEKVQSDRLKFIAIDSQQLK